MTRQPVRFDKIRIEIFSDVVIALVMAGMAFRLRLPETAVSGFSSAEVAPLAWRLAAYAMSYLVLAIMWVNHRQLAASLTDGPCGLQLLNLKLLFWITLVPAVTVFAGDHPHSPTALALYAGVWAMASLSFTTLRVWLARRDPDNPALAQVHFGMTHKSLAAGLLYAAAAPLAFVHPAAAIACLVIVPVMFLVPQNLGEPH